MIDIRELRIGNLVTLLGIDYNHGMTFPDPEGDEPVVVDLQTMGLMHDMPNRYAPIPLTPEWLLRMGQQSGNLHWEYEINLMALKCYCRFADRLYSEVGGIYLGDRIKYVHEIQNLYFALTGNELTIKP